MANSKQKVAAKKASRSNCDVTAGRVDLSKYEKLDGYWKELGLASPARRALVNNKVLKATDLKKFTEDQVKEFHGMGPTAMKLIKADLRRKKLKFKS
jgi:CO dehydrogenase nickel-insertion accessory protein CooC1